MTNRGKAELLLDSLEVASQHDPREWAAAPGTTTLLRFIRHPAEFCSTVANTFPGELVRVRIGLGSFVLVTDPAHVEHILVDNDSNYWKGDIFNTLRPIFGSSLLLSEGAQWRSQRRMIQPYFRIARLRAMEPQFEQIIEQTTSTWIDGAVIDVERAMRSITLRIIMHAMFSSSVRSEDISAIEAELERMLRRAPFAVFSWWAPTIGKAVLRRPAIGLDRPVLRLIEERRRATDHPDDLLTALLASVHEDGSPLSDIELRDHVVTIIFGGYEATATALHWLWLVLSRHPRVRERVESEIATASDADSCEYLQKVICETLRLFPPFWFSFRTAYEDDQIGRYKLKAGTSILISPYAVHRQPRYWPDPERFDPERFAAGRQPEHPCTYLPFLRGPRMCIGKHFADLEMRLVVKIIASKWRLNLDDPNWELSTLARGSLRPNRAPPVRLKHR